jgi:type II secretory pathway predicted ATPase ExeA
VPGAGPQALGHRSLYSRLHTRLRVEPLSPEDTAEYLRIRLQRVGCERELFGSDAVAMLHESASGALRDIDRLATAALKEAARRKKKLVERDVLSRVVDAAAEDA